MGEQTTNRDRTARDGAGRPPVSRRGLGRRLARGALALAASVLALGVAELGVRLAIGRGRLDELTRQRQRLARQLPSLHERVTGQAGEFAPHPFLGYAVDPGGDERRPGTAAGAESSGPGWKRRLMATDLGFYALVEEPLVHGSGPPLRVALFGGSVAMLLGFDAAAPLRAALEARWTGADRRTVSVATYALGGFKQPQQLAALSQVLLAGERPDLVINLDGFNEVALPWSRTRALGVDPLYPVHWLGMMASVGDPVRMRQLGAVELVKEARAARARRAMRRPWHRLAVPTLLWSIVDRQSERELRRLAATVDRAVEHRGFRTHGPRRGLDDDDAYLDFLVDAWAEASRQMAAVCRAHGIAYVHALQPNQYLPGSKPMGDDERQRALTADHPYGEAVRRGYPRLVRRGAVLAAEGITFVDLTGLFRELGEPAYIDDCCHLNGRGNELIAGRLAVAARGELQRSEDAARGGVAGARQATG